MNEFTEITAENLRAIRVEKGLNQDQLSEILGIPSNAISKIEGKTRLLSESEKKLLDFYFFGTIPPRITNTSTDPQAVLDFDEGEWAIIGSLARREGISEAQWIAARVRDYLAFLEAAATGKVPLSSLPSASASLRPRMSDDRFTVGFSRPHLRER